MKKIITQSASSILLSILIFVLGYKTFFEIPFSLYPETSKPQIYISLYQNQYSAEDFHTKYGADFEQKLMALDGIELVNTNYSHSYISWNLTFSWSYSVDNAKQKVQLLLDSFNFLFL